MKALRKRKTAPRRARRAGRIAKVAQPPDFSARDHLLDTAGRLMADRHATDISLSELAVHSGLNSALVKYYFGNKDGLLLALVERDGAAALQDLQRLLELDLPPIEKLRRHIGGIINNFYHRPYLNRLLHSFLDSRRADSAAARQITRTFIDPVLDLQRDLLDQGVQAGEFRSIDPMLFYVSVLGACDHLFNARYALQHFSGRTTVSDAVRERYIAHVVDVFVNGITARGHAGGSGRVGKSVRNP